MEIYRPTVRMDTVFQSYVNDVFQATTLDRNQIIRLMMFVSPHSVIFKNVISDYSKRGVGVPLPSWQVRDSGLWLTQMWEGKRDAQHDQIHVRIGGKNV